MKNVVCCVECTRLCGVMCAWPWGVPLREVPVSPACGLGSCGAVARAYTVLTGTVPPPRGAGAPLRTPQRPGAQGAGEAIPRINVHQYECQNAGVVRDVLGPGLGGTFRASIRGPLPDARIVARGRAADPTVRSDA